MKNLLIHLFSSLLNTPFRTVNNSKLINSRSNIIVIKRAKAATQMVFISYNFPLSRNFSFFCFCISFSNLFSFLQHFYFRIWSLQSAKKYCYTFESFLKIPWGHEVFRVFSRLFLIAAWVYHQKYLYIYLWVWLEFNEMNV